MDWLKKKKKRRSRRPPRSPTSAQPSAERETFWEVEMRPLPLRCPSAPASQRPSIKLPFTSQKPPALSAEEQQKRREMQAKALEQRGNAWEKRVANGRKARLHRKRRSRAAPSGLPPVVLSNEQVKARELQSAQQQMGFNPYAATFSSSTQAVSAMNGIGGGADAHHPYPVAMLSDAEENGAVYVILRQDPGRAITAAETLIKMLTNVVKNPQEEKFRKIRL
ncbi:PUB domain [Phytophthora cactorum]|nr:PUB domain [Phytophthora cactorum]